MTSLTDKGGILRIVRNIYRLGVQDLRLMLAEKLTLLASGAVMLVLGLLFGAVALAFLTISLADLFKSTMSPAASYAIIGGAYVVLVGLVYLCRNFLIFNPIARFISRVVLDDPQSSNPQTVKNHEEEDNSDR